MLPMTHAIHVNCSLGHCEPPKKIELNWFTGLEVIAKSWFMTLELWQVIHDSWQTCTLFFGSLWVTTKNVSSIGSLVEELWLSHDSWLLSHDKLSMTHGDHAHCSLGHYESPQKISAQLVHWLRIYKVMSLIEPELSKVSGGKCSLSPKSPGNCLCWCNS